RRTAAVLPNRKCSVSRPATSFPHCPPLLAAPRNATSAAGQAQAKFSSRCRSMHPLPHGNQVALAVSQGTWPVESYGGAVASCRSRLSLVDFDYSRPDSVARMRAFLLLAAWYCHRPKAQLETWPLHFVPPRAHGRRIIKRIS